MYNITTLSKIEYADDSRMEKVLEQWDQVLLGMAESPPKKEMEVFLLNQLARSKDLAPEVAHYRRTFEGGDANIGYDFLYGTLCKEVSRRQLNKNQEAMERALIGGRRNAVPAADKSGKKPKKKRSRSCRFYKKGICRNGDKCPFFAHGQA